jgi:hypothetical protein
MKTTRLQDTSACPYCAHKLDAATAGPANPKAVPSPGDGTICIECGGVLIFAEGLTVRRPTPDELAEILALPRVGEMIQAIHRLPRRPPR